VALAASLQAYIEQVYYQDCRNNIVTQAKYILQFTLLQSLVARREGNVVIGLEFRGERYKQHYNY